MPLTKVTKSLITSVDVSQINTTASDAGKVLTSDGSTLSWTASSSIGSTGITQGTAVTLTTQTSATFTGIPSTAKRVTLVFNGVSTSGTSIPLIRLGTSSGVTASGYVATAYGESGAGISSLSTTVGIYFRDGSWVNTINATGAYTCYKLTANIWTITGGWISTSSQGGRATGYVDLGNTLDRILLTTVNGTDTFDAGSINIMWE